MVLSLAFAAIFPLRYLFRLFSMDKMSEIVSKLVEDFRERLLKKLNTIDHEFVHFPLYLP